MRSPRLKLSGHPAVYHCISRTAGGEFLLNDLAKEQFRKFMWAAAAFCGAEVLTYTILSNHFHLLIRIGELQEITDETLRGRVLHYFGPKSRYAQAIELDIATTGKISPQLRKRLAKRMGDLSMYLKELKQRFTRWFNSVHERYGTLWAERFKSVIVEDEPEALRIIAAYIDLNCVRDGLVSDPKDYRFCGYAEALAKSGEARNGVQSFLPGGDWESQSREYRKYLFSRSAFSGHSDKKALDRKTILAKLREGGRIETSELLRLKVRYFTDGAALGSQAFLEEIFVKFRKHFGSKRKTGARPMSGGSYGPLMVLRQLRLNVFG